MKTLVGIFTAVIVVLLAILAFIPTPKKTPQIKEGITTQNVKSDKDLAIEKAKQLFQEKKDSIESIENGPCLSEEIISDWVVDVAHSPRQDVDNKAENQCQSFREEKTHHFVELDLQGNLIRAL